MDIQHFISLIRKYKNPTEVSDLMFTELIDKIVVYEAEGVGKARHKRLIFTSIMSDRSILPTPRRTCRDKRAGRTGRKEAIGETASA